MVGIRNDKTPFLQNSCILHSSIDTRHLTLNNRVLRREIYIVGLRIYLVGLCGTEFGAKLAERIGHGAERLVIQPTTERFNFVPSNYILLSYVFTNILLFEYLILIFDYYLKFEFCYLLFPCSIS